MEVYYITIAKAKGFTTHWIRVMVFFQQSLSKRSFAGMRGASD